VATLFTHGDWLVKPGKEGEFVDGWNEIAEWTARRVRGSGWARLLQDSSDPRRFVSFGPWESLEAIEAWRSSEGFRTRVTRLRELLDDFVPRTLELAAEVGDDEVGHRPGEIA
jgi:heme-degrading monooxygenase HmoA